MPLFRLEGDRAEARLVVAKEKDIELESQLESWLENSPDALVQDEIILWIDRQTSASGDDGIIHPDLLGVDYEGNLVIAELKRDRTPREVVAQLLEYAAWGKELDEEQIEAIAEEHFQTRDELRGRTLSDVFIDTFEVDEVPPLNQNLRLFVVAGEIPSRVLKVCRLLRSHEIDISCVEISTFQTESEEIIVSMETRVGNEERVSISGPAQDLPPRRQVVCEAVHELTGGDSSTEFTPGQVKNVIQQQYPTFNPRTVYFHLAADTVNSQTFDQYPVTERKYWRIGFGQYRLYDPERDEEPEVEE